MAGYLIGRLRLALLVLFTVSLIAFTLLKLSGDLATALAGENAGADYVAFLRAQYGWDRPIHEQYIAWLMRALQGDFGQSFYFGGSVAQLLLDRLPVTVTLGAVALSFALALSIPLAVIAALKPDSAIDRLVLAIWLAGALRHAGHRARLLRRAGLHPHHPWRHDRRACRRLCAHRLRQGSHHPA